MSRIWLIKVVLVGFCCPKLLSSAQPLERQRMRRMVRRDMSNTSVAGLERVTMQTVGKWRRRFVQHRLAGLADAACCGAPRTLSDAQVERVIIRTLESKPKHATHWST